MPATVLLTIDMQNDFALPSSPWFVQGTEGVAPRVRVVRDAFCSAYLPVIHVVRLYLPDGSNAELSRKEVIASGSHVVEPGTPGAELVPALRQGMTEDLDYESLLGGGMQQVGALEWIMYKPRWGAFYETPLEGHLRSLSVDTVVVTGCNFPNCPRTTVYEASERDFQVVIVPDATSGIYDRGLRELAGIGVEEVTADKIGRWLSASTGST